MPNIRGEIGRRIRVARQLAHLRAADLAAALPARARAGKRARAGGILPITVYRWEKGKYLPTIVELERIAEITGVDLAWLVTGKGEARCA
jgi:transcriptional regulator with XRE-family HTH domain